MRNMVTWSRPPGSHTSWGPISLPCLTACCTSISGRQNTVLAGPPAAATIFTHRVWSAK